MRFIGEAAARIREDYLRVLRFFRFHAWYGQGTIDAEGFRACLLARPHLNRLSAERLHQELFKLLIAPGADAGIELLAASGILVDLVGVPALARFHRLVALEAETKLAPSASRRLAALAVHSRHDVARLVTKLRLSRLEAECLEAVAQWGRALSASADSAVHRQALVALGKHYLDASLVGWAGSLDAINDAARLRLLDLPQRDPVPPFPLKGADVLALGVGAGQEVGETLAVMRQLWAESDYRLTRDQLLTRLRQRVVR